MVAAERFVDQYSLGKVGAVESFGGPSGKRFRLSEEKARHVRYVLLDWEGEGGTGSNLGAQLALLAQDPTLMPEWRERERARVRAANPVTKDESKKRERRANKKGPSLKRLKAAANTKELLGIVMGEEGMRLEGIPGEGTEPPVDGADAPPPEPLEPAEPVVHRDLKPDNVSVGTERWRRQWEADAQTMFVPSPSPSMKDRVGAAERWCDKREIERANIHRAWRALTLLSREQTLSLCVLHAQYGDVPPGLPSLDLWPKDMSRERRGRVEEYRRVCRLAARSGGSTSRLIETLHVDRVKRLVETPDQHRIRVGIAEVECRERLLSLEAECETLLEDAARDYLRAWETA